MDRHTKLLKEFSRSKTQAELLNKFNKSRKAINIGNSGTFGYRLKEGANAGKVIKHLKRLQITFNSCRGSYNYPYQQL